MTAITGAAATTETHTLEFYNEGAALEVSIDDNGSADILIFGTAPITFDTSAWESVVEFVRESLNAGAGS